MHARLFAASHEQPWGLFPTYSQTSLEVALLQCLFLTCFGLFGGCWCSGTRRIERVPGSRFRTKILDRKVRASGLPDVPDRDVVDPELEALPVVALLGLGIAQ